MLLFSTILQISDSMTRDGFLGLVVRWNQTSSYSANVIPDLHWNGERNIRFGSEELWMEFCEYRNRNIIAVRHEKTDADGAVWDTDFVMNFDEMRMAVQLDRSYLEDALAIRPDFSTPHFITLLIEAGFLRPDGILPVTRTPHIVREKDIPVLGGVINGNRPFRLPVVYVSKTALAKDPVDTGRLAGRLKGAAHVLVADVGINPNLRLFCHDRNEYNGAVGIYYPNAAIAPVRYLYHREDGPDEILFGKILRDVIRYSNAQNIDGLYTWQGVANALLTDRLTSQRAGRMEAEQARIRAESETADVYAAFDAEIEALERRLSQLNRSNEALRAENAGLRMKIGTIGDSSLLRAGEEDELYPGEITGIVREALESALSQVRPDSRRADILRDILSANGGPSAAEEKQSALRTLLKIYDGMTPVLRQGLEDLGFEISEDGKHFKLAYRGDGRYSFVLSKTPSDWREGKNAYAEISGRLF